MQDRMKRFLLSEEEAFTDNSCLWPTGFILLIFIKNQPADVFFPKSIGRYGK